MSELALTAAKMINMLPETDQRFALEFIRKLVLAWDPDYTKLTESEMEALRLAESSGFIREEDIDWDHLEEYV